MSKKTPEEQIEYLKGKIADLEDRDDKRKRDIKKLQLDLNSALDDIEELQDVVFEDEEGETESPADDGDPPEEGESNFDADEIDDVDDDSDDDATES